MQEATNGDAPWSTSCCNSSRPHPGLGNVMIRQEASVADQEFGTNTSSWRGVRGNLVSTNQLTIVIEAVYSEIESSIAAKHAEASLQRLFDPRIRRIPPLPAGTGPSFLPGRSFGNRMALHAPQSKRNLRRLGLLVSYGLRRPLSSHTWGRAAHPLGARKFAAQCRLGAHQS